MKKLEKNLRIEKIAINKKIQTKGIEANLLSFPTSIQFFTVVNVLMAFSLNFLNRNLLICFSLLGLKFLIGKLII
jgi:hypothetical protein